MTSKNRYSRQLLVPEIGAEGQKKLAQAAVLVVGAGGLGSPVIAYLAGAGVGVLGIIDYDMVDLSNLHRQILFKEQHLGCSKAVIAARMASELNSQICLEPLDAQVTEATAEDLMQDYDVIVDAVDGFTNKLILNAAAARTAKPLVHAGVLATSGQISVFTPPTTACLRCLVATLPEPNELPTAAQVGIVGPAAGVFGCLLAMETIKLIIGHPGTLTGRLLQFDLLTLESVIISVEPRAACPVCGTLAPRANR